MEIVLFIFVVIFVITFLLILYFDSYDKLNDIVVKMDGADKTITDKLHEKFELMNKLYDIIKKIIKKKDYLKDFSTLKIEDLNNHELDSILNEHLETMITIKDDYKAINTEEYRDILNNIKELDEEITANKKYFNKYNNKLIKILSGFTKIIAKIKGINVKTSYEVLKDE